MSTKNFGSLALVVVVLAAGGGYWFGQRGHEAAKVGDGSTASAGPAERKILYYRNPMGQPDTSPVPKKDSMGMDYIPVYAGEESAAADEAGTVNISPAKVQKLGVRTERVERRALAQTLRAVGRIEVDERRLVNIAPRFEGWIERLHVNTTGQPVSKGQPLFEVYSPDLISAQREYQIATQGLAKLKDAPAEAREGMRQLAEASLSRLKNWELSKEQLSQLSADSVSNARRTVSYLSPANGVVLEKKAVQGMRFMPGEMLYQIADTSQVWVVADVFERDVAALKRGQPVSVQVNSLPGRSFAGKLDYIYPTLNAQTRTVPVRVELANADGALRPAMYVSVEIHSSAGSMKSPGWEMALVVPVSAVLDGGTHQSVLIAKGEGKFAPRKVKLGQRSDDYVEVLDGVAEGDMVVVAANFLIDSESQLKAVFNTLTDAPKVAPAHHAVGTLDAINVSDKTITVSHAPVASLKWPAMTMDFVPADASLIAGLKPGAQIEFDFKEGKPGEWVISSLKAKGR
jgi:Cu(I)/Ag(I) efflux system membrane fusion protein